MRAVFPDFLSGEIVVNADGSVRIAFAQNTAGNGNACFVAVHFKTLVQHSAARIISVDGIFLPSNAAHAPSRETTAKSGNREMGFMDMLLWIFIPFASARKMAATNFLP